jgi:hypothetical protein
VEQVAKQDAETIQRAIQAATEMVRDLPVELKEVAFSKAFDALINNKPTTASVTPSRSSEQKGGEESEAQNFDIDRTRWYPLVSRLPLLLAKSMLVMRALQEEAHVEWSSPAQIHRILTERLRQPAKPGAVRMGLIRAGRFVDRRERGGVTEYRLMAPGDEELDRLLVEDHRAVPPRRPKAKRTSSPISATKALNGLIASGFFGSDRTASEVVDHLSKKKALNFRQEDLSVALMRMVRRGDLDREKNTDGIYSYRVHPTPKDEFAEGIIRRGDQ